MVLGWVQFHWLTCHLFYPCSNEADSTLSDQVVNQGTVCVCMHFITWTLNTLTFIFWAVNASYRKTQLGSFPKKDYDYPQDVSNNQKIAPPPSPKKTKKGHIHKNLNTTMTYQPFSWDRQKKKGGQLNEACRQQSLFECTEWTSEPTLQIRQQMQPTGVRRTTGNIVQLNGDILTFSQCHTNGLVLCFPSVANAALGS